MTTLIAEGTVAALRALVHRYCVRWEAHVHYRARADGIAAPVGFEVLLLGTNDGERPTPPPEPGSPAGTEIYSALRRIATWVSPRERRPTVWQLLPFEAAVLYPSPGHRHRDIGLRIWLLHREGTVAPIDECERRCLAEIEGKLELLGARREE